MEVAAKIVSCFEGTRSALLAHIGRWMSAAGDNNTPLYILDGIAGIGKSTVAITVAHRAASIHTLGATFFFSQDHEDRNRSLGFVHTIAHQLACFSASYGKAIAAAIDSTPEALDKALIQQFNLLVAKPLVPLLKQRVTPLLLVFDALDECVEPDASVILSLIISSISQLPNVKVFLTTRPKLTLSRYMDTPIANVIHFQEVEDFIAEKDISSYIDYSLSPAKIEEALGYANDSSWQPTAEDKAKLAKLSGKLFLFASTAIKFILDEQCLDPKSQLARLLDPQSDNPSPLSELQSDYPSPLSELQSDDPSPLSELNGLYLFVLNSAKPVENAEQWLHRFQKIVGAILVLQASLPIVGLAKLLDLEEYTIRATLANLHSVVAPFGEGPALTYKLSHKSFFDYLTGPSCPPEFQVVEEGHHLELTKSCLKVMERQLRFNICQVPPKDQYQDLLDLLQNGLDTGYISKELEYAVCNWANHLSKLEGIDSNLIRLLQAFLEEQMMHWIEALAYINQLDIAHIALEKAATKLVCQNDIIIVDLFY
jgi:hypothetical protein